MQNNSTTNDPLIREALRKVLNSEYINCSHFKIVEEFGVCKGDSRIDLAVVNGIMHGFEIKSDLDSLYRLSTQVENYNMVFDKMTLVVGKNHLTHSFSMIPDWWGVSLAKISSDGVTLQEIRSAETNPKQDSLAIAQILWRDEALKILEDLNSIKGYRSKSKDILHKQVAMILSQESLCEKVRNAIFSRPSLQSA
jgi:hypothetical protein